MGKPSDEVKNIECELKGEYMYNRVILIGRLTTDPELKATSSATHLVNFSLAVNRRYSGNNGEQMTDFITIVAWRQTAEFVCKYFKKGSPIGIEGSIQARSYEDKNGNRRIAVEIVADRVFFVEAKGRSSSAIDVEFSEVGEIDLPF